MWIVTKNKESLAYFHSVKEAQDFVINIIRNRWHGRWPGIRDWTGHDVLCNIVGHKFIPINDDTQQVELKLDVCLGAISTRLVDYFILEEESK